MKEKKELSKRFWFTDLSICFLLVILIAVGFALFSKSKNPVIEELENAGDVILNYADDITGVKITNATPTSDAVGIKNMTKGQYFDFSVDVTLDNAPYIEYEISVVKDENYSTIPDDDIRIYLEQEQSGAYVEVFAPSKFTPLKKKTSIGTPVGSMVLYQTKRTKKTVDRYRLRVWVADKSLMEKGNYGLEVFVNAHTD